MTTPIGLGDSVGWSRGKGTNRGVVTAIAEDGLLTILDRDGVTLTKKQTEVTKHEGSP